MQCAPRCREPAAARDLAFRVLCTTCTSFSDRRRMVQSRGFVGRRGAADVTLPPGQYLTKHFPVLSAGPTPDVPLEQWELTIDDGVNVLRRWSWKEFRELPT